MTRSKTQPKTKAKTLALELRALRAHAIAALRRVRVSVQLAAMQEANARSRAHDHWPNYSADDMRALLRKEKLTEADTDALFKEEA